MSTATTSMTRRHKSRDVLLQWLQSSMDDSREAVLTQTLFQQSADDVTCLKITPPRVGQQYLGGGDDPLDGDGHPHNNNNSIDAWSESSSAYRSIPRLASLPPCPFQAQDPDVQAAAAKLWHGDFHIAYNAAPREGETFVFYACMDPDDTSIIEQYRGPLIRIISKGAVLPDGRTAGQLGFDTTCFQPEFSAALYEKHKDALSHRIMHHLLRCHGAKIATECWPMVEFAFVELIARYQKKKCFEAALDVLMIQADIMMHLQQNAPLDVGLKITKVGEALEAMGRFAEAGSVYHEVAETLLRDHALQFRLYEYAGLAYKRAEQFDHAERNYVQALRCNCQLAVQREANTHDPDSGGNAKEEDSKTGEGAGWDLNEKQTTNLLTNMLMFYDAIARHASTCTNRVAGPPREKLTPALLALLYAAGFQAGRGGLSEQMVAVGGKQYVALLQADCQSPEGARRALTQAVQDGTVSSFHQGLVAALDPARAVGVLGRYAPATSASQDSDHLDRTAQAARNMKDAQHVAGRMQSVDVQICGNPTCRMTDERTKFMCCPCRSVYYCQKSCQTSHWKLHKALCPWHNENKKKAASQK